jgi:YegS/Rv2252/BmrU family lipid kinase
MILRWLGGEDEGKRDIVENNFKTFLVVNPKSAGGNTERDWPEIRAGAEKVLGEFAFAFTSGPMDATAVTRRALRKGYELIVSVGGDGTNNEVINGFFEADGERLLSSEAVFGVLSMGSGGDFRKSPGWRVDLAEGLERLRGRRTRRIDAGKLTFVDHRGEEARRYFINIASFGVSGAVMNRVNRSSKLLGGRLTFLLSTVQSLFAYRNKRVELWIDDRFAGERIINNVAVANGRYFGAGMHVAPRARLDDGLFDVVIIGDLGFWDFVFHGDRIYRGTHLEWGEVEYLRARKVVASSDEEVLIEVDGEQPGRLPAIFEVLPGAIRLKV